LQSSTRFTGFKLPFEKAVETARYPFSTAITGLKPGANEMLRPLLKIWNAPQFEGHEFSSLLPGFFVVQTRINGACRKRCRG
jgi:hypothetical protein